MKKFLLITAFSALFASCSDDDANNSGAGLNGSWAMTSYLAFMDEVPTIEHGDVVYDFDLKAKTLTIENNVDETYPYLGDDGIYPISISGNIITVDMGDYTSNNKYRFDNGELIIEDAQENIADGPVIRFERITHNH